MEKRKAQLTGGSTFTVSLPKEWATDIGLETGDPLSLYPRENTLLVQSANGDEYWSTTVEVDQFPETRVRQTVQALYTAGFNHVTLRSSTDLGASRRVIASAARKFIGLEVIESAERSVTLRSLLDPSTVSVEQSTVQLEQIALSMHEDAVTVLFGGEGDVREHVVERDNQVDRLYAMISRHFQRSLENFRETEELDLDQSRLYALQTTARQLERVGDHAEKIAALGPRFENGPPADFESDLADAAERARGIVERAASTVIRDEDVDTAYEALCDRDELTADLQDLERQLHEREVEESHLVALVIDSLVRTAEYGGNIAETALRSTARDRAL